MYFYCSLRKCSNLHFFLFPTTAIANANKIIFLAKSMKSGRLIIAPCSMALELFYSLILQTHYKYYKKITNSQNSLTKGKEKSKIKI